MGLTRAFFMPVQLKWSEHLTYNRKTAGSNPATGIILLYIWRVYEKNR